jgi:PAS domain-containing protein
MIFVPTIHELGRRSCNKVQLTQSYCPLDPVLFHEHVIVSLVYNCYSHAITWVMTFGTTEWVSVLQQRIIGTAMGVTEHELLTEELRRREAYLAEAQRLSHTGSFGWKVSSGELYWSDETFRIFQCDARTKPTVEFALSRVHPEDRDFVQQQIERASRHGEWVDLEHRLQLPDRSIKHLRVSARPSWDSSGELEFVGAITDVSEQRHAEGLIRDRERTPTDPGPHAAAHRCT